MTDKQKKTLVLFAQNYSLQTIANKQRVSLATIRERIKSLSKNHPVEFGNTLGVRESYKRVRSGIREAKRMSAFYRDFVLDIEIKSKF